MLWSLFKIVLFVCLIAALTLGAGYLMESSGGVRVSLGATEYTFGALQAVIAALLLVLAVWLLLKLAGLLVALFRFLNGDETALSRHFDRGRHRRGLQALGDGLMALASGEGKLAMAKAEKAERYLNQPRLTDLLTAQAAEMAGDRRRAEATYKRLLGDDRTRFVGVRGLMHQKLADGDTDTALALAKKAFALKPKHAETQDTLLKLQTGHHDWAGARQTLAAKLKHGTMPRDVHRRRDAVLALSEADALVAEGSSIETREAAIEANRLSPDLIPAAAMAARHYIAKRKPRYAARVVKKAWEVQPHPELAAAFAEIRPEESRQHRVRRFQELSRLHPDHPETKMLMAELNIAAEDFPAARRALGDLAEKHPTSRSLAIMAAIERGEGAADAVVRGWLTRALTAPRGPQWVCDNCRNIRARWAPVCDNCGGFDTLAWREPPAGEVALPAGAEMLPLITGHEERGRGALVPAADPAPGAAGGAPVQDAEVVDDKAREAPGAARAT